MGKRSIEKGPTAERVAANMKAIRKERRLSLDELAARLKTLGRPILKTGLSKIETGERRVDVDDLMVLALALLVTPNRLLLDPEADPELSQVTDNPTLLYSSAQTWAWACGEVQWGDRAHPSTLFGGIPVFQFQSECRPHNVPTRLSLDEWRQLEPWQKKLDALEAEMTEAGADFRALVPDRETYEEHDEDHAHG